MELDAVLNTTCTKCGTRGHLAKDCFNVGGDGAARWAAAAALLCTAPGCVWLSFFFFLFFTSLSAPTAKNYALVTEDDVLGAGLDPHADQPREVRPPSALPASALAVPPYAPTPPDACPFQPKARKEKKHKKHKHRSRSPEKQLSYDEYMAQVWRSPAALGHARCRGRHPSRMPCSPAVATVSYRRGPVKEEKEEKVLARPPSPPPLSFAPP